MKRTVYIVNPSINYIDMFKEMDWQIVQNLIHADMVQFTGGEDVSPHLYGEKPHNKTYANPRRDYVEVQFYQQALKANIPMAGICRGGQFLNVMNGGKMWQHVDGHGIHGTHECFDVHTGETFQVTSTHHQMMIPAKDGATVLGTARESSWKEKMRPGHSEPLIIMGKNDTDIEIVFYKNTKCLCFQPHPEFSGYDDLRQRYFNYIAEFLFPVE
jgi:carbamoylphosphate synthase small subunit